MAKRSASDAGFALFLDLQDKQKLLHLSTTPELVAANKELVTMVATLKTEKQALETHTKGLRFRIALLEERKFIQEAIQRRLIRRIDALKSFISTMLPRAVDIMSGLAGKLLDAQFKTIVLNFIPIVASATEQILADDQVDQLNGNADESDEENSAMNTDDEGPNAN